MLWIILLMDAVLFIAVAWACAVDEKVVRMAYRTWKLKVTPKPRNAFRVTLRAALMAQMELQIWKWLDRGAEKRKAKYGHKHHYSY